MNTERNKLNGLKNELIKKILLNNYNLCSFIHDDGAMKTSKRCKINYFYLS